MRSKQAFVYRYSFIGKVVKENKKGLVPKKRCLTKYFLSQEFESVGN